MAALALALKEEMAKQDKPKTVAPKKRLSFDASITMNQVLAPFQNYITYKTTKDLYSLLAPPAHMPQKITWHQRPCAEWMVKISGLIYDVLELYSNTKACSSRVVAVVKHLHTHNLITNTSPKKDQDFYDTCDLMLRVVLAMFRKVKCMKADELARFLANSSRSDAFLIQKCLDVIQLDTFQASVPDPQEASPAPVDLLSKSSSPALAAIAGVCIPGSWASTEYPKKETPATLHIKASPATADIRATPATAGIEAMEATADIKASPATADIPVTADFPDGDLRIDDPAADPMLDDPAADPMRVLEICIPFLTPRVHSTGATALSPAAAHSKATTASGPSAAVGKSNKSSSSKSQIIAASKQFVPEEALKPVKAMKAMKAPQQPMKAMKALQQPMKAMKVKKDMKLPHGWVKEEKECKGHFHINNPQL